MRRPPDILDAIVVRSTDYGESDRILGFLTASRGKISAFAPSARKSRKRFGGGLDLFSYVRAKLHAPGPSQSHLWRLAEVELVHPHLGLRSDLRRLASASYLAECLWTVAGEEEPQPKLFVWFRRALIQLSETEDPSFDDVRLALELLSLAGYAPRWTSCTECAQELTTKKVFFSFLRGGVSCDRCEKVGEGRWIDNTLAIRVARSVPLTASESAVVRNILDCFLTYTVGRPFKSQGFREEIFRASA